jgi:hypothetical protein
MADMSGSDRTSDLARGPRWNGSTPDGISDVLRFETDIVFVIGRTQLLDPTDLDTLGRIMASYRLEPLSAFSGSTPPPPASTPHAPTWRPWPSRSRGDRRMAERRGLR